ncbi:hypothetical protein JTB14_032571 [Gonioctena quinquepunctata]|nr:hypothetical protein JTB14_032571 [Gonioctena quinquepunctata]
MPSNTELKVSRTKALRQTAINRLTLISESAVLAKTNSEDRHQFKVRHRDLKKVIKDFEKHHNTTSTLLAGDGAKIKEEHEHEEEFVNLSEIQIRNDNGISDLTVLLLRSYKPNRLLYHFSKRLYHLVSFLKYQTVISEQTIVRGKKTANKKNDQDVQRTNDIDNYSSL